MQCTEKIERASSEREKSEAVDIKSPGKSDEDGVSSNWSRSSPSKKIGDGPELSSDALHDMASVLDRSAGAGDKSLQEVANTVHTRALVNCQALGSTHLHYLLVTSHHPLTRA